MTASRIVVLLAEDEVLIRMTIEDVLLNEDVEVVSVGTGDAAINELQENAARFHLIISDIRMPGSADGWSVARAARELSPYVGVIYITGDSASKWSANGVSSSILLQKPFSDRQLVEAIKRLASVREG